MAQPNPSGQLFCCLGCGRDTRAKSGYCQNCGGIRFGGGRDRGRKTRDLKTIAADPNDDGDVVDRRSDREYHGSQLE